MLSIEQTARALKALGVIAAVECVDAHACAWVAGMDKSLVAHINPDMGVFGPQCVEKYKVARLKQGGVYGF